MPLKAIKLEENGTGSFLKIDQQSEVSPDKIAEKIPFFQPQTIFN